MADFPAWAQRCEGQRPSKARELRALVERAAVGAAGKLGGGRVREFGGAEFAAEHMAKGGAFAALAAAFGE
jgi:hypothetical protein